MLAEDVLSLEDFEVPEIGRKVKALRESKRWSQRKLGSLAGTSGSYISQLEAGLTPKPGVGMLQQIAIALGVSLVDITGEGDGDDAISGSVHMDPEIEKIHVNLLTMRELDPDEIAVVDQVVLAMLERLKKRKKEREQEKAGE